MQLPPLPRKMGIKKILLATIYAFCAFVIFMFLIFIVGAVVGATCAAFMAGFKLF